MDNPILRYVARVAYHGRLIAYAALFVLLLIGIWRLVAGFLFLVYFVS